MEVLGFIAVVIHWILQALMLVIIISALLSWIRPDPRNPFVRFVDGVSAMVCNPIRRVVPTAFGGFDLAPLFAILLLEALGWLVNRILLG
jgi:YggT family protein